MKAFGLEEAGGLPPPLRPLRVGLCVPRAPCKSRLGQPEAVFQAWRKIHTPHHNSEVPNPP